jgi:O-antigen/teichoic acid export membrane protein
MDGIDTTRAISDGTAAPARTIRGAQVARSAVSLTGETLIIRVIALGISFISNIIVARQLGPEGRGILALLMFWSGLVATIVIFGLDSALIYLLGSSRGRFHRLLLFSTAYVAIVGTLVGFVVYSISNRWITSNISGVLLGFLIGLTVITMLQTLLNALFIGIGRISLVNISALLGTCFYLLLLIVFYAQKQADTQLVLWANVGAQIIPVAMLLGVSKKIPRTEESTIEIKETLLYALKAYLGNIAGLLSARSNFLILSLLVSVTEVGIFSIAQMFSDLIMMLPMTLINVLLPRFTILSEQAVRRRVSQTVRCTLLVGLVGAIGIGGLATILISAVFGARFALAVPMVWLLVLGSWLGSGGMVISIYFNAQGRPEVPSSAAWFGLIVTSLLTFVLAWRFGGLGAAAALSLSRAATSVFMLVMYTRSCREPWPEILIIQPTDWQYALQSMQNWYGNAIRFHKA